MPKNKADQLFKLVEKEIESQIHRGRSVGMFECEKKFKINASEFMGIILSYFAVHIDNPILFAVKIQNTRNKKI